METHRKGHMVRSPHEEANDENLQRTLQALRDDVQSVKRHLIFLEDKQESHEAKTEELIHLYKGAGIIGKLVAWAIAIAGGIGGIYILIKSK